MNKKCDKYESLFIFADNETLEKHLQKCEYCRQEHERMNKVSQLIHEVKDEYKKPKNIIVKVACILCLFTVGTFSIGVVDLRYGLFDTLKYGAPLTMDDLGFQTDDYGLIQVD